MCPSEEKSTSVGVAVEKRPKCKLVGTDGNVFAIIGNVSRALKRAGMPDKANEWAGRAMGSGSYEEVLVMLHEYVKPY
jgi:hypothetical protein